MLHIELKSVLVFLVAFFGALFVLPKIAFIARRIGLIDQPGQRKVHSTPRPLVGGVGMMISAAFASLLFVPLYGLRGFFSGLAVLLLVGFLDDFKKMGHRQKFLAQIVACCLLIYLSKTILFSFGNLLGFGELLIPYTWLAMLVTIFCVVGVINAINLIDGLDGLAGGISFVAFMIFAAHASFAGNNTYLLLNLAFAGAVLGFLRFNWYPSVLFMGDAGSLCLGFALAFMAVSMSQGANAIIQPITALLILAVPIVDTLTIMSKRVFKGKSPFQADQHHLHHIFMRYGMTRELSTKVIIGMSLVMASSSLLSPVYNFSEHYLFSIFGCYFVLYYIASLFILDIVRFRLKLKRKKDWREPFWKNLYYCYSSVGLLNFFRKSVRHNVSLPIKCYDRQRELAFEGVMLNLSQNGFMAAVPDMNTSESQVDVEITVAQKNNKPIVLELPVENIWISECEDKKMVGFKFPVLPDDEQLAAFNALLLHCRHPSCPPSRIDDQEDMLPREEPHL